jgi:hypothetical protein
MQGEWICTEQQLRRAVDRLSLTDDCDALLMSAIEADLSAIPLEAFLVVECAVLPCAAVRAHGPVARMGEACADLPIEAPPICIAYATPFALPV